jgi:hypothetical protein
MLKRSTTNQLIAATSGNATHIAPIALLIPGLGKSSAQPSTTSWAASWAQLRTLYQIQKIML